MASSEWMELQNLSNEILDSQGRLEAAKSVGSLDLAEVLAQEIAEMEKRRERVLAHIANSVITEGAEQGETEAKQESADEENSEGQQESGEVVSPITLRGAAAAGPSTHGDTEPSTSKDSKEGLGMVWNQLTPADVERAKEDLDRRRAEILARHAEELKALEADKAEIDTLELAIATFMKKFSAPAASGGEVVRLKQERHSRAQAGG